ncbi:von Willebrand factor A domain-containing protein 7-like [Saccostrea cucullata]|uniref:von Willebrand factor A domain-containing protein 7-like n=1 Tax=Saccostrea cuccullata TaxID=36930 RepID=UPI002ED0666B
MTSLVNFAFPPQAITNEIGTKSHSCITFLGIYRTAAEFLTRYNYVNNTGQSTSQIVRDFFGTDSNSYTEYLRTISKIVGSENDIQVSLGNIAFYHVHGEQIQLAHNYIRSLRHMIQIQAQASNPNIELIREKIGYALYTLQEFYSNTNWVELNGDTIYSDFGQENVTLTGIAGNDEETCVDCNKDEDGVFTCEANIITTLLTSGYKSGQDIVKILGKDIKKGKCSIGTSKDESRNIRAKGGIYKGRSTKQGAPHYNLHTQAVEAAIKATKYFLMNEDVGIINILGRQLFQDVFHLKTKESVVDTSLTFVVDVTGSMAGDIASVIKALKTIVENSRTSKFVPSKYVLVTFSDPESLTKGMETSDWLEMIRWIEAIRVDGGGDCPEFALSGMLKGIELSGRNSKIFLCTDASPKDGNKKEEVIDGLRAKSIKPTLLVTGHCGIVLKQRRKDVLAFSEPNYYKVFESIAEESGGSLFLTDSTAMEEIIIKEIEDTFPSSTVSVQWFELDPSNSRTNVTEIFVDSTINFLQIEIRGVLSIDDISVQMPNGTEWTEFSMKDNIIKVTTLYPSTGVWKMTMVVGKKISVNVTAQSQLDFDVVLLEASEDGINYQISGSPISGHKYTIALDVQNLRGNSTCDSVLLLNENGSQIIHLDVQGVKTEDIWRFFASFSMALTPIYSVLITGRDSIGNKFMRTKPFIVKPVGIKLDVNPFIGELSLNASDTFFYTVFNYGESTSDILVTISDDQGSLLDPVSIPFALESGEYGNGSFTVRANKYPSIIKIKVTVTDNRTNEMLQTYTRSYSVSDINRPMCTSLESKSPLCPPEAMNTINCSLYDWNVTSLLDFSGVKLSSIDVSNKEVNIVHKDVTEVERGPINVILSGQCCYEKVVLSATDENGFTARCVHVLSNKPMADVEEVTRQDTPSGQSKNWAWIITFSILAVVCVIILFTVIAVVYKRNAYKKREDFTGKVEGQHNLGFFS